MRFKQVIGVAAVSAAISASIGFGLSQASQPEPAKAGGGNVNKQILGELRDLNKANGAIYKSNSIIGLLYEIEKHTDGTCKAVGPSYAC